MGRYVNPSNFLLRAEKNSKIWVDKTGILSNLNNVINTNDNYVAMSRPRRFGKSYVGSMMCAYYSVGCDSHELLADTEIAKVPSYEEHLNKYNFIYIDLNDFVRKNIREESIIEYLQKTIVSDIISENPDAKLSNKMALSDAIFEVYKSTGRKFVIFIDEYDVIFREFKNEQLHEQYLTFLSDNFKSKSMCECFALVYVTGILPIIKDRTQSKMNEFKEITFLRSGDFSQYMGFTEEETKALCEKYEMDFNQCLEWYDGYRLDGGISVLSPKSVVEAMLAKKYCSYWSETSTFKVVLDVVTLLIPGIKDLVLRLLAGEQIKIDVENYDNTADASKFTSADQVFTFCTHLGYLAYDQDQKACYIPNNELRNQWRLVAKNMDDLKAIASSLEDSQSLLDATIRRDAKAVAEGLCRAHNTVPALKYSNEAALQMAIGWAYYYAQGAYTIFRELPTGTGYADVVFLPKIPSPAHPAIVIELKVEGTAETALKQIEEKHYGADFFHYSGNMLLVGVSYNKENKKHSCEIKQFVLN